MLQRALELIDVEKEPLLASRIYAVRADHVCAAVGDPKEQQAALDRAVAFAEGAAFARACARTRPRGVLPAGVLRALLGHEAAR